MGTSQPSASQPGASQPGASQPGAAEPHTSELKASRPVPVPEEASLAYWNAAREGRLVLPRCADCSRLHFPPQLHCPHCGSGALAQTEVTGTGTLYSHTVLNAPPGPGFVDLVPLQVGVVELDAQPMLLMTANLSASDASEIRIGARVEVYCETLEGSGDVLRDHGVNRGITDISLPQFKIVEA